MTPVSKWSTGLPARSVVSAVLTAALACVGCAMRGGADWHASVPRNEPGEVEALVKRFVDHGYVDGIATALVRDGRIRTLGHGEARENGAAPDAHTLFDIGSVTKLFTTLTLATMVADGEVALDEPVANLLPAGTRVPEHGGEKITLLSLATHTSGLPAFSSLNIKWDADWLYETLSDIDLARAPGVQYEYSNLGVALLGHALAARANKPIASLVKERVLAPLGMGHTYLGAFPADGNVAVGHDRSGAAVHVPAFEGVFEAAGGARSDTTDMAEFVRASLDPPPGLRTAIRSTQAEHGTRPNGKVGLGWHIGLQELPRLLFHNGDSGYFHSFVALDVEKQLGVVVLANTANEDLDLLGYALLRMLRGEPHELTLPRLSTVSPEALDRCTGRFEIEPGFDLAIRRQGAALLGQFAGQGRVRIYPLSETSFYILAHHYQIDFEMGPDGHAKKLVLRTPDGTASANRID